MPSVSDCFPLASVMNTLGLGQAPRDQVPVYTADLGIRYR